MIKHAIFIFLMTGSVVAGPYHAHPHKDAGEQEWAQANFLITESLSRIAEAYDSLGEKKRRELLIKVLNNDSLNTVHNLKYVNDYEDDKLNKLESQIKAWQRNFPRTSLNIGEKSFVTLNTEKLLYLTHKISRISYKLSLRDPPQTVKGILDESVFGPNRIYQSEQVKSLNEAANAICAQEHNSLDDKVTVFLSWAQAIRKKLPGALVSTADELVLGKNKSCSGLSDDVMDIVSPHLGILRPSPDKMGQLEGTSIFLAEKLFENKKRPLESPLSKLLMKLENIKRLDKSIPIDQAMAKVLGMSSTDERLINLFAVAGHNHGLETYVLKLSLELVDDPNEAVKTSTRMYRAINNLYRLIDEHKKNRKAAGGKDLLANSAREYHYWGGALVACELTKRGYKPWISEKVSTTLGSVYEKWTSKKSGEGMASSQEDIYLHMMGANDWAQRCKK